MSRDVRGRGSLRMRRPGSLLCVILAFACAQDGTPPQDVVQLDDREVQLPEGSQRHDVRLEGVGAGGELSTDSVAASIGDAVAFIAADAVTHSIVFMADRLDSAQIAFLESSGQMRGPPLLSEGSSWIVNLSDAPPGAYPFACALHGGRGVIHVMTPAG